MGIRKKTVNGQEYYYLEETIRLETPKVYSLFLGKRIPPKRTLEEKRKELLEKIYANLLDNAERRYLTKEQLIEVEKQRRRYLQRVKGLGKAKQEEKEEIDTVNFVYTTLTTEGVPVTREDADLAYRFAGKNVRGIRDENLNVALDMINGLRYLKESKKGISRGFILDLHKIIMEAYKDKNPGKFRTKQAYIYLKSHERAEEIRFRPPAPSKIEGKIAELVEWYNLNMGKLNAVELAALLHLRLYMIHPFDDGNKRMSRLLFNKAFFDSGYPMLNISKETQSYFDALIRSAEKEDEKPFVLFVAEQLIAYMRARFNKGARTAGS
ncbi:Fic/DOC family protein [uncultured archaeon]|nr:Fic/DOC family protein [uncultured archaeon]